MRAPSANRHVRTLRDDQKDQVTLEPLPAGMIATSELASLSGKASVSESHRRTVVRLPDCLFFNARSAVLENNCGVPTIDTDFDQSRASSHKRVASKSFDTMPSASFCPTTAPNLYPCPEQAETTVALSSVLTKKCSSDVNV